MFNNADEVLQFIGDNKVEFVDVRFSDLLGTVQHFTVPTETFDEKVFTEGRMFDGKSRYGVSVFDFTLPKPGRDASSDLQSRFIGYGAIPGLLGTAEPASANAKP